jgi:pimeloyl-ACP methyl ester carboxylesterase
MLILHGGMASSTDMSAQIEHFSQRFKVIAPDRRGHGRTTDDDRPYSFQELTLETVQVLRSFTDEPAMVVGWSDGGIIALHLAFAHPEVVSHVVMIGAHGSVGPEVFVDIPFSVETLSADDFTESSVRQFEELSPNGPEHINVVVEKLRQLWISEPNLSEQDLRTITVPVMIAGGDRRDVSVEHFAWLRRHIPHSELLVVNGANHNVPETHSALLHERIDDFLARYQ